MRIRTKDDFFKAIDSMDIFAKDYVTIEKLMKNLDDALFVRILEEVLDGNLYWSDFESVLDLTGYDTLLQNNIPLQQKLHKDINMFTSLRNELGFDSDGKRINIGISFANFTEENENDLAKNINNLSLLLTGIKENSSVNDELKNLCNKFSSSMSSGDLYNFRHAIVKPLKENNITNMDVILNLLDDVLFMTDIKENAAFYREEFENLRDNHLYNLIKFNSQDSVLTRLCKDKLYNAIKNGKMLNSCTIEFNESTGRNDIKKNGVVIGELNSDYNIVTENGVYEYINVDDILLSIQDGIIPIAYEYQVLDSTDYEFMRQNNISEEMMKQFKSLETFLRRKEFFQQYKGEEE